MESLMNSFTLRQIPAPIEKSLRRIAQQSHKSLNKTIIELLAKATGVSPSEKPPQKRRNVQKVFRKWSPSELSDFEQNIKIFESIDEELWKP